MVRHFHVRNFQRPHHNITPSLTADVVLAVLGSYSYCLRLCPLPFSLFPSSFIPHPRPLSRCSRSVQRDSRTTANRSLDHACTQRARIDLIRCGGSIFHAPLADLPLSVFRTKFMTLMHRFRIRPCFQTTAGRRRGLGLCN